ncbi:MAG: response regulator transcription factor [Herbaspirillum sp.]|jgi:FixJ family two-component response regulator|nr:response regulator transcription factor [Herbaspirillum sp.]
MSAPEQIVYIVDDDRSVREALSDLLSSLGLHAVAFRSAAQYIAFQRPDIPACLLLDIQMPGYSGLKLQTHILEAQPAGQPHPPIVFITGFGDIPTSVRAIRAGAVDFLTKPFNQNDLIRAIDTAFAEDRKMRSMRQERNGLQERLARLTPRERQVLALVVDGRLNKQAAAQLGISEVTFQFHRGNVMQKMAAGSLAELVRMAGKLGIPEASAAAYTAA